MRATLLALISISSTLAGGAPCGTPSGVVPAIAECVSSPPSAQHCAKRSLPSSPRHKRGLCFKELVPVNPSGITIRDYTTSVNSTFASGGGNGAYPQGIQAAIANVISYFSGANDEARNILAARTVPFAVLPPGNSGAYWSAFLEVSPTQFPDDFLIPRPIQNRATLSKVDASLGSTLIASFQYNTTGFPYLENIQEACGVIQNSTLPAGYAINTTHPWSPSYIFYNGQNDANFTSECWMAVYKL
jgi:hypothetical protein